MPSSRRITFGARPRRWRCNSLTQRGNIGRIARAALPSSREPNGVENLVIPYLLMGVRIEKNVPEQ